MRCDVRLLKALAYREPTMLKEMRQRVAGTRHRWIWLTVSLVALVIWLLVPRTGALPVNDPFWWLDEARSSIERLRDQRAQLAREAMLREAVVEVNCATAVSRAQAGNVAAAVEFFRRATNAAELMLDTDGQRQAYIRIAADQARSGDIAAAEFTASQIRAEWRGPAYEEIALAQLKAGDVAGALGTVARAESLHIAVYGAHLALAISQAQAGNQTSADASLDLAVAKHSQNAWAVMVDRCAVAHAQVRRGDLDGALLTAQRAEDPDVLFARARAAAAVAVAQARSGDRSGSEGSFNDATRLATMIRHAPSQTGRIMETIEALLDIAWAQSDASDHGDSEGTRHLAMQVLAPVMDGSSRDQILGEVVTLRVGRGDVRGASACAAAIESEQDQAMALARIAQSQFGAGDAEGGIHTIAQIRSPEERDQTLLRLIDERLGAKAFGGAVVAAAAVESPTTSAAAHRRIVEAFARAGAFDEANAAAERIPLPSDKSEALLGLGRARDEAHDAEGAKVAFEAAVRAIELTDDTPRRASTLHDIAQAMAEVGDVDGAVRTVALLKLPGDNVYRAIALAQIAADDLLGARETQTRMKKNGAAADDVTSAIAAALAAAGEIKGALDTAASIKSASGKVRAYQGVAKERMANGDDATSLKAALAAIAVGDDRSNLVWAYSIASQACAASGDLDGASDAASKIMDGWLQSEAYQRIARRFVQIGDVPAALEIATKFRYNVTTRDAIFQAIVLEQIRAGDHEGALATAATEMMPPLTTDPIYEAMAREYADTGRVEQAIEVASRIRITDRMVALCRELGASLATSAGFDSAVAYAAGIDSGPAKDGVLRGIADAAANAGIAADAQTAAAQIENATAREDALVTVIGQLTRAGRAEEALAIVSALKSPDNGYRAMVEVQIEAGDLDAAAETSHLMKMAQTKDTAFLHIAQAQVRADDLDGALRTALKIRYERLRDGVYRDVLNKLIAAGDYEQASSFTEKFSSEQTREQALGDLAAAWTQRAEYNSAKATAAQIGQERLRTSALQEIARAEATEDAPLNGPSGLLRRLLEAAPEGTVGVHYAEVFAAIGSKDVGRAQSHLGRIESDIGIAARVRVLCEAICHHSAAGQSEHVQALFERARSDALRIEGPELRCDALKQLIAASAAVDRFDQAFDLVSQIDEPGRKQLALASIAMAQADAGRIDESIATATLIKNDDMPLARVWLSIATAQVNAGFSVAARDSFAAAVNASQGSFDPDIAAEWLHEVIRTRIECGDFEGAIQDASPYSGSPRIVEYFKTIGCTAVQSGKTPQLLELIRLTKDPALKSALQAGAAIGVATAPIGAPAPGSP